MALPRFLDKLSADRRIGLIAAAAEEFAAKGYKGALLEAIAEKAEIGKSSFYYYFSDKADLCQTVLDEAWRRLSARGRIDLDKLTAESFWPMLEEIAKETFEACARDPWLISASKLLNRTGPDPPGKTCSRSTSRRQPRLRRRRGSPGQALGVVRNDVPAELLATISLNARQASNLWLLDRMETLGVDEVNRMALLLLGIHRALLASPESDASPPP